MAGFLGFLHLKSGSFSARKPLVAFFAVFSLFVQAGRVGVVLKTLKKPVSVWVWRHKKWGARRPIFGC
ncbi:hypothetical protein HK15_12525 [Acetobacter orientalis]|uniref:Uncharacterized protein n=1 Tax=Acetobacter orientalis TaxID=146474 RepID=A0A252BGQ6_9PROT|nr:hypothetical protein HK15_12525 [Acetobacter orientalis]